MSDNSKNEVKTIPFALDYARAALGQNTIAQRLAQDWKATSLITTKLRDMGQTHAINLTHKYSDAAISLALYSGDGIVTKIIPGDFFDRDSPIHTLPPITLDSVESGDREYVIATYPYVRGGGVSQHSIEELRTVMNNVGLRFTNGDDRPDNVHRMPDKMGTLVGIDADMFIGTKTPDHEALRAQWQTYLEGMYPSLYVDRNLPIHSENTDFRFISIHDRDTKILGFDAGREDPIIMREDQEEREHGSFWGNFLSPFRRKSDGPKPDQGNDLGLH